MFCFHGCSTQCPHGCEICEISQLKVRLDDHSKIVETFNECEILRLRTIVGSLIEGNNIYFRLVYKYFGNK